MEQISLHFGGAAGREGVDHSHGWRLFATNTLPKVTEVVGVRVNSPYAQPLGHTHTHDNIQLNAKKAPYHFRGEIITKSRTLKNPKLKKVPILCPFSSCDIE